MQTINDSTLSRRSGARLMQLTLAASSLLLALAFAPAYAQDSGAIARPAAARDIARGSADQKSLDWKDLEDDVLGPIPFKLEPLRELVDKYAPSAIEWTLLPRLAETSTPSRRHQAERAA
jgi:hypothetical protein